MLFSRFSVLAAFSLFTCATWTVAQVPAETLISNYGQPNAPLNGDFFELTQRLAWDFTTGADAYDQLILTLKAAKNEFGFKDLNAEFYTSTASAPGTLVGTLSVPVRFTEGSFQDFSSAPGTFTLQANTTYWVVLSLADPLNNPGSPGILVRQVSGASTDAGGLYSSVSGTQLLTSSDGGSTWTVVSGTDAVKYILEGVKAAVVVPVVPPDAVTTAASLQNMALQNASSQLEDFAMRLFRARSGQSGSGTQNSLVINLGGEDELVELGEGDGPESGLRQVALHTGSRAGQLRIFSSFDYGYADLNTRVASHRTDTYAGTLGVELSLTDHFSVGGGMGALSAQTRVAGGIANVDTDGLSMVTYATYHPGSLYVDVLYAATLLDNHITRGANSASPDSSVHTVQFNTGHNFTVGHYTHGPFVSLNYAHATTDPYEESGAGAVSVGRQNSDTLLGRIGWQASARFKRDWGSIIPQLRLSWDKQYLNDMGSTDVALVGVPGVVARTGAAGVRQNGLGVGAGVMLELGGYWSLAVNYQAHMLDKGANVHNASLFVSCRW